jgi:hypothetical protein
MTRRDKIIIACYTIGGVGSILTALFLIFH